MKKIVLLLLTVILLLSACTTSKMEPEEVLRGTATHPPYSIGTLKEYKKFVKKTNLPEKFVPYEALDFIGEFYCFLSWTSDASNYGYGIIDAVGANMLLRIFPISEENSKEIPRDVEVDVENKQNMRWRSVGNGYVEYENIRYYYFADGDLGYICWDIDNLRFTFSLSGGDYKNYPKGEDTFLQRLLSLETASDAMDEFLEAYNNR